MSDTNSGDIEKTSVDHFEGHTTALSQHSAQWERDQEYYVAYPNRWAFVRNKYVRDFASEFLGQFTFPFAITPAQHDLILVSLVFARHYDDHHVRAAQPNLYLKPD